MDKVQKIREEIEKLHKEYRRKKGAFHYRKALRAVLFIIDSMQEEPVSEELGEIVLEGTNFNKSWYAHPELAFKAGAKWQLRKTRYEKDENNKK